jgi:Flp pilus assembly pilin Flp
MTQLLARIAHSRRAEHGQGLAEYALILSLIALVAVIALIFMGTQVSTMLHTVGQSV